jgi:hypothetical protein
MKRFLWVFAFISVSAFADSGRDSSIAWIKGALQNKTSARYLGESAPDETCGLFLDETKTGSYQLTLATPGNGSAMVDIAPPTQINYSPSLIFFTGSFAGQANTVAVQMDDNGKIIRAVGSTVNKTIDCKFK